MTGVLPVQGQTLNKANLAVVLQVSYFITLNFSKIMQILEKFSRSEIMPLFSLCFLVLEHTVTLKNLLTGYTFIIIILK